ncbi:MAG: transcription initiation factor TFIID subunit 13 [Amphiamblys sp. WSBS2006]|nr:MAG: transcription initiation factor TFIID subunit 13 [Amphiamblys sp. WSBS2006]
MKEACSVSSGYIRGESAGSMLSRESIEQMVYGFGDVSEPREDTVDVVERIAEEYIQALGKHTERTAHLSREKRSRVRVDDVMFVLRNDKRKLARVEELLYLDTVFTKIKSCLNTDNQI